MQEVSGKVAFVTGGASGIGLGMVKTFLRAGMRVMLADIREDHLAKAAAMLHGMGEFRCVQLDVADRASVARAADEAERVYGRVHVLCNNAGVGILGHVRLVTFDDWDWCLSVNLGGVINGIQTFLPRMLAHGEESHIVNTSSIGAVLPGPGGVPYLTAKGAIFTLTQALQADLADEKIGLTVLVPGPTATNIHEVSKLRPERFRNTGLGAVENKLAEGPLFTGALDPERVGEMVLNAIRTKQLYVFTHGEFKASVQEHLQGIIAAFPHVRPDAPVMFDTEVQQKMRELVLMAGESKR